MTSADVRDMLGLPTDGQPKIRPPKKPKHEVKGKKPGELRHVCEFCSVDCTDEEQAVLSGNFSLFKAIDPYHP